MKFVLDASVSVRWFIVSQQTPYSRMVLERAPVSRIFVPAIWPIEMAATLIREVIVDGSALPQATAFLEVIETFDISVAAMQNSMRAHFVSGGTHRLRPADATYVELALALHLPLATEDKAMIAAAQRAGVPLLA
jgi:predicted nucleic acid-binding protein